MITGLQGAAAGAARALVAEERRIEAAYARRARRRPRRSRTVDAAQRLLVEQLERALRRLLDRERRQLAGDRILEVGCGTGYWLRRLCAWGASPANLVGIDLLPDRIAAARDACPPEVTLRCANAVDVADPDGRYDLILQFTTFTSIRSEALKRRVAQEMLRVLAPGGVVVWYDFFRDNPRNPDVRGVGRRELASLFPGCTLSVERVTLAPPLARLAARVSPAVWRLLHAVPLLRTHYLATIRRLPTAPPTTGPA